MKEILKIIIMMEKVNILLVMDLYMKVILIWD